MSGTNLIYPKGGVCLHPIVTYVMTGPLLTFSMKRTSCQASLILLHSVQKHVFVNVCSLYE